MFWVLFILIDTCGIVFLAPYNLVDLETSMRYMESDAYKETYGDLPVWYNYRRNHKYPKPPKKTRRTCVVSLACDRGAL